MFVIRPIAEKELQKEICKELAVPYKANALAYYAANLAEDKETVTDIIGICQFTVGENGTICTLYCPPSFMEDEAMIVLCRTVTYFMHRIGIKKAELLAQAGPKELLSKMGFHLCEGVYQMDLEAFYSSPCKYVKE